MRSRKEEGQSLALSLLATIMPSALTSLADAVFDIALSSRSSAIIRKKALICLSRMLKKDPNQYDTKKIFGPLGEIFESTKSSTLSLLSGASSLLLTLLNLGNP